MNMLLWTTHVTEEHFPLFKSLKNLGYDGVQIPVFEGSKSHYQNVAAAVSDAGLRCSVSTMTTVDKDPSSASPAVRSVAEEHLKRMVDMTVVLGADLMIGPFYAAHSHFKLDGTIEQCRDRSAELLKRVCRYAQDQGVTLSVEFLNRFETMLLNCTSDSVKFIQQVDEPNLGVLYDTHHAHLEESSVAGSLGEYAQWINHVHFSESHRGILGDGLVHWQETCRMLKQSGYAGDIAIEAFADDVPGLTQAAHVWRRLFDDKLELCKQSVQFAQSLMGSSDTEIS